MLPRERMAVQGIAFTGGDKKVTHLNQLAGQAMHVLTVLAVVMGALSQVPLPKDPC